VRQEIEAIAHEALPGSNLTSSVKTGGWRQRDDAWQAVLGY
jgi:hypothetical protein